MEHRVRTARKSEPKWDAAGTYAERCAELARDRGLNPADVHEEWSERAAVRQYLGGVSLDVAEALAWEDVLARFEVRT